MDRYDLIIIGSGPGGYAAAIRAAQLGMRTALIEKREIGGTCLNRGCIPTKTLMHTSHFYHEAVKMEEAGIRLTGLSLDFEKLKERKEAVVGKIRTGISGLLKANGVTVFQGTASILSSRRILLQEDSGKTQLETEKILIATGSLPIIPNISKAGRKNVVTSDELLAMERPLYGKLLIIGGGVIGVEFATIYRELGCEVEIIEAMDRILPGMDKEIAQSISMGLKKKHITIHTGARVTEISEGNAPGLVCRFIQKYMDKTTQAEGILLSVGRRANTQGLFGEDFTLQMEGSWIRVNEKFETSVPGIYAIGDVIRGRQLAHAASAQGIAAVEGMSGLKPSVNLQVIPSCIYTVPEAACVGLDEEEAVNLGYKVKTGKYPMLGNSKTLLSMGERGFIKVVCDADTGRLLGAQLLCDRATDMVGEFATAIVNRLTYKDLASVIRPHPTYEEAVTEAVEDVDGMAIHLLPKRQ